MNVPERLEYRCVRTGDGSPTLCLAPAWEHMHALEGAFTETRYIYSPAVQKAFDSVPEPRILSVGLGLGYNELLSAFESLKRGSQRFILLSYESLEPLRKAFEGWLTGQASEFGPVYDEIAGFYARTEGIPALKARELLAEMLASGRLQLQGAIESSPVEPATALLFDAFSQKSSPELWHEDFLSDFFAKASGNPCFAATYACKGSLKRALRLNGYVLDIRKGFGVKRESTFAVRA